MNPDYKSTPSLDAARATLMEERWQDKGTTCPYCDQHAQVYARKLRASQVRWLVQLVRLSIRRTTSGWVDKSQWLTKQEGGDYAKLELWGLIESMSPDEAKRLQTHGRSGIWRPTSKGIEFAYGRLAVPETVWVYNGEAVGCYSAELVPLKLVYIHQVLDKPFDYAELKAILP